MKKFENYQQFLKLIKDIQKQGLKNINCYLMPNEIAYLINKNSLFYLQNENALQIIEEKDNYFKVSIFANENFKFIPFECQKPIITDLPYSGEKSEKFINNEKKLEKEGFVINAESSRMVKNNFEHIKIDDNFFADFEICKMQRGDEDYILKIWNDNFDTIENLLYSKSELIEHSEDIFVCKDKNNKIVGAMEIVISGLNGWIQKIAIDKNYQGRGLGSFMEIFYINKCKMLGIKSLLLYTIDDNLTAQIFHKKFGFKQDGKHNCQYIYRR